MARPGRIALQGDEHAHRTAQDHADADRGGTATTRLAGAPIAKCGAHGPARADHSGLRRWRRDHDHRETPARVADHGLQMADAVFARSAGRAVRRAATRGPATDY